MGLQEHDLIMAAKKVSGKTVKKNPSSRVCWTKRLGQVSKYNLKIQKMQKQFIRKISSQWHFKCMQRNVFTKILNMMSLRCTSSDAGRLLLNSFIRLLLFDGIGYFTCFLLVVYMV